MCNEFNDFSDIDDATDEILEIEDISDGMPKIEDIVEDGNDNIDEFIDSLSLDELRDLRADLTVEQDIGEDYQNIAGLQDISEYGSEIDEALDSMSLNELKDLRDNLMLNNQDVDSEWDEGNDEPQPYVKVLKR